MTSTLGRARIIANPRAGRGDVERAWPAVRAMLDEGGLDHDVTFTERPGHAIETARAAASHGTRLIVAMGGDGTVHEVVNGMMASGRRDLVLGVVPSGSGCDFARTFGISQDAATAARHLLGGGMWGRIDVGRVRYRSREDADAERWFVNIAEAGIGASVVASATRLTARLGARAYRLAALTGIASFRPAEARIDMHGRKARGTKVGAPLGELTQRARVTMVVVANGQFFGGGLRVTPRASPSDGLFDVLVGEGSRIDAVRALRKMPNGLHVPAPVFTEYLAERVRIDGALPVEADGEWLGTTPASFEVVPEALALKI